MSEPASLEYPPAVAELIRLMPLAPLGPGKPQGDVRGKLEALEVTACCRAGLWLAFGYLDESHEISQAIDTAEGSFWHAIMHRREPDAWNSKYWWRRVGDHPVFAQLAGEAAKLGWRAWDAAAFVDECEKERGTGSERELLLREAQRAEWERLFAWCWERGGRS
jgi:hypothetical protein